MKKERKMKKKLDSDAKSFTISKVDRCCCNFFVKIFDEFYDFVSECVSFQRKINNPFWGVVIVFSKEKWQLSFDVKQTHISPTKINVFCC